jgi:transposase
VDYTEGFRQRMIERLVGPNAVSANVLSKEVGVSQNTLSRWLREAPTLPPMGTKKHKWNGPPQGPRKRTGAEKLQLVLEAAAIPEAQLGEFLRKKGIHEDDLKAWRELAGRALEAGNKVPKQAGGSSKRIKQLEQEIAKKDKRLRAVNALLELQKKVREIWGDADENTTQKSES